ncbi:MAG TPA: L,D-transpeptidase [Anaerolineales bacterium]|nr:L,D-transpeptidase [Anaerolineales bacterium]
MNPNSLQAHEYIVQARAALQRGDKEAAWKLGCQASLAAPRMEEAWLILAASDPNAQHALAYARRALEVNPNSPRAHRAIAWVNARHSHRESISETQRNVHRNMWLFPTLVIGLGCLFVGLLGLFVWTSPAFASILINASAPAPIQENLWAPVDIAKPTVTPIDVSDFAPQIQVTPSEAPSEVTKSITTATPTSLPTETPTGTSAATETPSALIMELVDDNQLGQSNQPSEAQGQLATEGNGELWIDVNLSQQRVYAYAGNVVVNSFLVSTGLPETPTVTGRYRIWVKVRIQDMSGPGYYLKDVPYVMYFYKDYGLHGTYWHNNFGRPMSRGCVNLTIDDAKWLYNWASVGAVVDVHY